MSKERYQSPATSVNIGHQAYTPSFQELGKRICERLPDALEALGITLNRHSRTACPVHGGGNETELLANFDDGTVHCFECGYHDNVIGLARTLNGLPDRKEAIAWLASRLGLPPPAGSHGKNVSQRADWAIALRDADDVLAWRQRLLDDAHDLRYKARENARLRDEWARRELANPTPSESWKWPLAWFEAENDQVVRLTAFLRHLESLNSVDLLELYEEVTGGRHGR